MTEMDLDDIDRGILELLERDAKTRLFAIARKLGIPPSTAHHRIQKLEKEGVIRRWTIEKDFRKLGLGLRAYILIYIDVTQLKRIGKTQKDLAVQLKKIPHVERVDIISGDADLVVFARARDMEDLGKTILERIQAIEGITKTKTMVGITEP